MPLGKIIKRWFRRKIERILHIIRTEYKHIEIFIWLLERQKEPGLVLCWKISFPGGKKSSS